MAINLFGDPYNLQGSSGASLQGGANPQQAAGLYGPPAPAPTPTIAAPKPAAPVQAPIQGAHVPPHIAQRDAQINSIFSPYIDSRPSSVNPGVLEYYNKQTGQGFSNQQELFNYASQLGAGVVGSFDQLHAPVNSSSFNTQVQSYQPVNQNQTVAQDAGTSGLSVDDYLKLLQQQNQITPDQLQKIQEGLGIPAAAQAAFVPPSQSTVDFYNSAYTSAGLNNLTQQIQAINDQINKRQQDFIDAQGTINENPFLSEASRVGRISRLNDKAQEEIGNLTQQQVQLQQLYQNGIGEVNNLVQAHGTDFAQNQQQSQAYLQYLLGQATNQSQAVIAQNQQNALQYLPAYLQAKAKANPQQTVTSPTTGAIFRWDPNTGTFQTVQGPTPTYSSVTGPDGTPTAFNPLTGQYGAGSISIPAGSLAATNNNPGNLRYVGQAGATQGAGGFAKFSTPEAGYQALVTDLQGKMSGSTSTGLGPNRTLADLINVYAPPSENNTSQYIQQAATALGVSANAKLNQIDVNQLAQFIAKKESSTTVSATKSTDNSPYAKDIRQTADGSQYLNSDTYSTDAQKTAALNYARANGIAYLNGAQSQALEGISQATLLLNQIQTDYQAIAAKNSTDVIKRYLENPIANATAYGDLGVKIAQYQADRTKAINLLRATAGGGGLRINEAEIAQATTNDLPDISLPLQAGLAKINSARNSLATVQQSVITSGGGTAPTSSNNDPLNLGI